MAEQSMNPLQRELLSLLASSLQNKKYSLPNTVDWEMLYRESRAQAVALQVYDAIADPSQVGAALRRYALSTMWNNAQVHKYHAYLHRLMTEHRIAYCVMKGCASAYYYPNPGLRTMGDVDFLVKEEDMAKTAEILQAEGFSVSQTDHVCHWVFQKDKMHLEMHFVPAGMPNGEPGVLLRRYLTDIFETAAPVDIDGETFQKPDDFHHGLILLMHTYHHMVAEGLGLRHLCDWAVFIQQIPGDRFVQLFQDKLSACGLWRFTQIISYIAVRYLGVAYQAWMGQPDEPLCDAIMEEILTGGNFGAKDRNRADQAMAISNRGKDGFRKPPLVQLVLSLNRASVNQFPILKRWTVLKPFGWIMLACRRCFRVLRGSRKLPDLDNMLGEAANRRKLYQQLHLFEMEEVTPKQ